MPVHTESDTLFSKRKGLAYFLCKSEILDSGVLTNTRLPTVSWFCLPFVDAHPYHSFSDRHCHCWSDRNQ